MNEGEKTSSFCHYNLFMPFFAVLVVLFCYSLCAVNVKGKLVKTWEKKYLINFSCYGQSFYFMIDFVVVVAVSAYKRFFYAWQGCSPAESGLHWNTGYLEF